jgi:predicted NBD/HSP70 family sugar kinase
MESTELWGIDIGGTKTAFIVGNEKGDILHRIEKPTKAYSSWQKLLSDLLPQNGNLNPFALAFRSGIYCL